MKVSPSGSRSALDLNTPDNNDDPGNVNEPATEKEVVDGPYLGSWKTKEEAEKGLKNLTDKLTKQGEESGYLKRQVSELTSAMANLDRGKPNEDNNANQPDKNKTGDELEKVFDEYGSLDFFNDESAGKKGADLLKKAVLLTAKTVKEETLNDANSQVKGILQERDIESHKGSFLKNNPDFAELAQQGVLRGIKEENPLHDDLSAYFDHKFRSAAAKVSELEAALAEAKGVAELAEGDKNTAKVFTRPGDNIRGKSKKPQSVRELKQATVDMIKSIKD